MRTLVVGGGVSGLTTALELHRMGHEVTLMERQDSLRPEGYMMDFFGPGFDVAERLGLLPALSKLHYPIRHLVFVDERGKQRADLPYPRLRREVFRDRHFNIMRGDLERVLFDTVVGRVRMCFATSPVTLDPAGTMVAVKTNRGNSEYYDLVVAADGFRSRVRDLAFLAGESSTIHLGSHTAAYVIDHPIEGLAPDAFVSMSAPGFTAAAYPIRGGRTATFFLHRAPTWLEDRSAAACRRELEATYRGRGWILDQLLDAFPTDGNVYFDDVGQIDTLRWSEGRVVMVGDAAACVSLMAGQGASLAMFSAYALAQELRAQSSNVPRALESYEARVRPLVSSRKRAGVRNVSWVLPRGRFGAAVRDQFTRTAATPPVAWILGRFLGVTRRPLD
jgi:2-polyprenyl-6-methoxyphenol hydroxylase-like FAD-dependent oxidoreductase